jgi:hypothetical protein
VVSVAVTIPITVAIVAALGRKKERKKEKKVIDKGNYKSDSWGNEYELESARTG